MTTRRNLFAMLAAAIGSAFGYRKVILPTIPIDRTPMWKFPGLPKPTDFNDHSVGYDADRTNHVLVPDDATMLERARLVLEKAKLEHEQQARRVETAELNVKAAQYHFDRIGKASREEAVESHRSLDEYWRDLRYYPDGSLRTFAYSGLPSDFIIAASKLT